MTVYAEAEDVVGTCGLEVVFAFDDKHWWGAVALDGMRFGGIGYGVAGFINDEICKEAYKKLCKRFHLEYQSPVKRNPNSGNLFFFCVFRNK